ncbi:type II toxin-antitoxin system RelE/ParE family toxin [Mucilaginibacter sp. OK098]|uniref:type II toxin-antitoxin system RelE/ParE family toxin n=1 Tax=Mucilaginibacter sp. OK098 TaxID=1855297 RepID=UPI00091150F9|nr:type II toxin-antitoxin system RelE/ParE family toxin [Mucilaginibacter sp. OK098]SHN35476.1 mRNA-degrading endonuclease RelE, toxin component of the RelBE toxin-antitoxin system [Mucilaginibacter sp. OK098]
MSYDIIATPRFKRDIKKLAKKYLSIKNEYTLLINELEKDPQQGISLGNNCYKIRISIASKGKGKSGGARVITHIVIKEKIVFLLTIYDKAEKENITEKELNELLGQLSD